MDEPENDRIHVHRDGIFGRRYFGAECRGLNAFIDDGDNVVDDGNHEEKSGPFDAVQFARAKDDELFASVGHLQRRGDDDDNDHDGHAQVKVPCCA